MWIGGITRVKKLQVGCNKVCIRRYIRMNHVYQRNVLFYYYNLMRKMFMHLLWGTRSEQKHSTYAIYLIHWFRITNHNTCDLKTFTRSLGCNAIWCIRSFTSTISNFYLTSTKGICKHPAKHYISSIVRSKLTNKRI